MSVIGVKFWGVRGSIACPAPNYANFGGNTSCVQVEIGDLQIVLDAGTGLRGLGQHMLAAGQRKAKLLLTHFHWDHTNGFPFFGPAYSPQCEMQIMAGGLCEGGVREALAGQMSTPNFPVPLDQLQANLEFQDIVAGDSFMLAPGVRVRTAALNHPDGATAYRLEHAGRSICYVTDTEHVEGEQDEAILQLIEGANLMIYDSTYTDEEFPRHIGWGHSTWQEGVRLCQKAGVQQLAIFHHDPGHDDAFMKRLEEQARQMWAPSFAAREGMIVEI